MICCRFLSSQSANAPRMWRSQRPVECWTPLWWKAQKMHKLSLSLSDDRSDRKVGEDRKGMSRSGMGWLRWWTVFIFLWASKVSNSCVQYNELSEYLLFRDVSRRQNDSRTERWKKSFINTMRTPAKSIRKYQRFLSKHDATSSPMLWQPEEVVLVLVPLHRRTPHKVVRGIALSQGGNRDAWLPHSSYNRLSCCPWLHKSCGQRYGMMCLLRQASNHFERHGKAEFNANGAILFVFLSFDCRI